MATREQVESVYNHPNVRRFLDMLSKAEGTTTHGYNTGFGNTRFESLADHPRERKSFTQTDGKKNITTAAGRYQFIGSTWDGVAKQVGLKDFSPRSQDLGAIALLFNIGAMPSILGGDWETAIKKSGGTWASLPTSTAPQNKKSWATVSKYLNEPLTPQLADVPRGTSLQGAMQQSPNSVANAIQNMGLMEDVVLQPANVPRETSLQEMVDTTQVGVVNNEGQQYDWQASLAATPSSPQPSLGGLLQTQNNILIDTQNDNEDEFVLTLNEFVGSDDYGY